MSIPCMLKLKRKGEDMWNTTNDVPTIQALSFFIVFTATSCLLPGLKIPSYFYNIFNILIRRINESEEVNEYVTKL